MMMLKRSILIFIGVLLINVVAAKNSRDLSGRWCWDKSNNIGSFTLFISKKGDLYKVEYSAVANEGARIDDGEDAFSFKVSDKNYIKTKFKGGFQASIGLVELRIIDDKTIRWHVLKAPEGEYYFPDNATLNKQAQ